MICARCGAAEVAPGSSCTSCGAVAVAPDLLDSVLSLPAEPVPEDLDEGPATFSPLAYAGAPTGPLAEVDDLTGTDDLVDAVALPPTSPVAFAEVASSAPAAEVTDPAPPVTPTGSSAPPLPRRTSIDATAARWGPRDHPPAVLAPPPPHPLDAPAVARVRQPSRGGTGLPAGFASSGPAPVPTLPRRPVPAAPSSSASGVPDAPLAVPDRPSHPRVRRWFGRGGEGPADVELVAPADPVPVAEDGPFRGAPEGLLDGVAPEPDLGEGVHDPAGIDAATSRLSAGARRNALAPLATVAALLEPGEVAEAVVQGEYQHRPGVVVLTDRRVVVANDRRWSPDVRTFTLEPGLVVHGWQDDRRATLVLVVDAVGVVVEAIADRPLARDLAQRIRARCGDEATGPNPA